MTRNEMMNNLIHAIGFENEKVIRFCKLCEKLPEHISLENTYKRILKDREKELAEN